jgi:protein required for attachment to host cells
MQFPNNTTIAVSDGQKLRLFRNTGTEQHLALHELPDVVMEQHNKGSGKRHSSAANPDSRQPDEDSYASATAQHLNKQVLLGQIEHLYIVAPPRTLGELRRNYHPSLKAKLLGELGKEHANDTVEMLERALVAA